MTPPQLSSEAFADPFRFLDAKLAEYAAQRLTAREALKACGWVLRPNHPLTGVWRARRWTKKGVTLRLMAQTPDELVRLAQEETEARKQAAAERKQVPA